MQEIQKPLNPEIDHCYASIGDYIIKKTLQKTPLAPKKHELTTKT